VDAVTGSALSIRITPESAEVDLAGNTANGTRINRMARLAAPRTGPVL